MIYSHAKVQGQWPVGSENTVKTNGWMKKRMEAIALRAAIMWPEITASIREHTHTYGEQV